jgi:hypothetical protein
MKKGYKYFALIVLLSLLLILVPTATGQAQDGYAYIIVHAHNPEGVEIASIHGMNPLCVQIYDGDNLIGYGAYNEATNNKEIAVSAGTHTIKARFNGITEEQSSTLDPGETKVLTFTFKRTEFDLLSQIAGLHQIEAEDEWVWEGYYWVEGDLSAGYRSPFSYSGYGYDIYSTVGINSSASEGETLTVSLYALGAAYVSTSGVNCSLTASPTSAVS